jgi:hypothetical protein
MRIAFMGTPDFAVPTLDALLDAGHDVAAVYTQPPRPAGRGKALLPSPVQKRAEAAGLAVRTPASLRSAEEQQAFAALDLEGGGMWHTKEWIGAVLPGSRLTSEAESQQLQVKQFLRSAIDTAKRAVTQAQ